MRRQPQRRPLRRTVLLIGEGRETEYNYFLHFRDDPDVKARFALKPKRGKGYSAENVVRHAINQMKSESYDEVWCVLDVETPDRRETLDKAINLAAEHKINLCLSNPSIEVWFLYHFARLARHFNDCEAVITELNKHWNSEWQRNWFHVALYDR